jgi:dihydroorotase
LLDVAVDRTNWSLEIASKGLELGILPDTLSTDLTPKSIDGPSYSLLVIMSKFLAAGFSLEQLVEMTTINPAQALREEQRRGSLGVGMPADISIFEITEGDFVFNDGLPGKTFTGKKLLEPRLTIKSGREIETRPHFRNAMVESGHPVGH